MIIKTFISFLVYFQVVLCVPFNDLIGRTLPTPPSQDPFYTPPEGYENQPLGAILKSRKVDDPIGFLVLKAKLDGLYKIMYRTSDSHGDPEASITSVLVPENADFTKLLSYQIAEDSAYIDCSPSYAIQFGVNPNNIINEAEVLFIEGALNLGWVVNTPDYEGPKSVFTAGIHEGQSTLDSIRAALQSQDITGLHSDANLVLWGHSGGSIASGWATLMQPTYAPELTIHGTAVGGFVVDIEATVLKINKGAFSGFAFAGFTGLTREYPDIQNYLIGQELIESKAAQFNHSQTLCVIDELAQYALQDIFTYLKDGDAVLNDPALHQALTDNNMTTKYQPSAPFFIYHAVNDEIAPFEPVQTFVNDFCAKGVNIQFNKDLTGEHVTEMVAGSADALLWLQDRMNGKPVNTGCKVNTVLSNALNLNSFLVFGWDIANILFDMLVNKKVGPVV